MRGIWSYLRRASRFPKRSTETLRSMKISTHVLGVSWLALSLLWGGAWQMYLWAIVGLVGLTESALVEKEIARRALGGVKRD